MQASFRNTHKEDIIKNSYVSEPQCWLPGCGPLRWWSGPGHGTSFPGSDRQIGTGCVQKAGRSLPPGCPCRPAAADCSRRPRPAPPASSPVGCRTWGCCRPAGPSPMRGLGREKRTYKNTDRTIIFAESIDEVLYDAVPLMTTRYWLQKDSDCLGVSWHSELLTCASAGCVVVGQVSTDGLDRDAVQLPGLQGAKAHFILVLVEGTDVQPAALSVQKHWVTVHVALAWRPAHLQAAALTVVAHVNVLHFTGHWEGTKRGKRLEFSCIYEDILFWKVEKLPMLLF